MEEQPRKFYLSVSNLGEPLYDDIVNSDLPKEEKVKQIKWRGQAYRDELDNQLHKDYARIGLGGLVSAIGALPIAITKNPVIGSAIGGGVYEVGQGIMEGDEFPELMQRAGLGGAIGGTVGGAVSKLPDAARFVNNLSGGRIGNALKPIGDKITNSKLYDTLMTDIKAFNPNKQTVYHGSPYDFNKFSNEAIGTGEGAQAHGMGHYAALNKDTAEAYAKNLSEGNKAIEYNGKIYKSNAEFKPNEYNYKMLSDIKTDGLEAAKNFYKDQEQWAREKLAKSNDKKWWEDTVKAAEGTNKLLDTVNPNLISDIRPDTGQLYKLSIPKDDVMLREGLPLNKQTPRIQKMYKNARKNQLLDRQKEIQESIDFLSNELEQAKKTGSDRLIYSAEQMLNESMPTYNRWLNDISGELKYIDSKDYLNNAPYEDLLKNLLPQYNNKSRANIRLSQEEKKIISDALNKGGIKGISYNGGIDGEARVIFNPDDIDIVRKYYNQPNLYQQLTGKQNIGALVDALLNR